jgi:hypothetical protein
MAAQVDPMKPELKPPRNKHLKVKCDIPLLNYAFKFNSRRYSVVSARTAAEEIKRAAREATDVFRDAMAGAYTRPLLSST